MVVYPWTTLLVHFMINFAYMIFCSGPPMNLLSYQKEICSHTKLDAHKFGGNSGNNNTKIN